MLGLFLDLYTRVARPLGQAGLDKADVELAAREMVHGGWRSTMAWQPLQSEFPDRRRRFLGRFPIERTCSYLLTRSQAR